MKISVSLLGHEHKGLSDENMSPRIKQATRCNPRSPLLDKRLVVTLIGDTSGDILKDDTIRVVNVEEYANIIEVEVVE